MSGPLRHLLFATDARVTRAVEGVPCPWHPLDLPPWPAGRSPVTKPGFPEPESFPVRRCLRAVLTEEWEHRLYAEMSGSVRGWSAAALAS